VLEVSAEDVCDASPSNEVPEPASDAPVEAVYSDDVVDEPKDSDWGMSPPAEAYNANDAVSEPQDDDWGMPLSVRSPKKSKKEKKKSRRDE
jgi:hypothetical protein